jgi:hypothetical protein
MKKNHAFKRAMWAAVTSLLLVATLNTHGVIVKGSGDPERNAAPPSGELQDSGWQYQGLWGSFLGTPIAPQFFLAAQHVGGGIGQEFLFAGNVYRTVAYWDEPNSDLRLWKVDGVFPYWAPLYGKTNELGKPFVVMGRGTQRGTDVLASCVSTIYATNFIDMRASGLSRKDALKLYPGCTIKGGTIIVISSAVCTNYALRGWRAGISDGYVRWGVNQISAADQYLAANFDGNGGDNEAALSSGDSSGAAFINDNGVWKLAGINYAVEGPFATDAQEEPFYGAIFDFSGLYTRGLLFPNDGQPRPTRFFMSRVSIRINWIQSITGVLP